MNFWMVGKLIQENVNNSCRFFNKQLGVPLAEDKTEDPVTVLIFLGLEIDSDKMEVRLPLNKVQDIISNLNLVLHKKRCTLKEMQSLIGSLNFA